jgi:hypothetical protein
MAMKIAWANLAQHTDSLAQQRGHTDRASQNRYSECIEEASTPLRRRSISMLPVCVQRMDCIEVNYEQGVDAWVGLFALPIKRVVSERPQRA